MIATTFLVKYANSVIKLCGTFFNVYRCFPFQNWHLEYFLSKNRTTAGTHGAYKDRTQMYINTRSIRQDLLFLHNTCSVLARVTLSKKCVSLKSVAILRFRGYVGNFILCHCTCLEISCPVAIFAVHYYA